MGLIRAENLAAGLGAIQACQVFHAEVASALDHLCEQLDQGNVAPGTRDDLERTSPKIVEELAQLRLSLALYHSFIERFENALWAMGMPGVGETPAKLPIAQTHSDGKPKNGDQGR